jgi:hypothetical protein
VYAPEPMGSTPIMLARAFCSKKVTLDDVITRVREFYATMPLEVEVDGEGATFKRPGLTIRVDRIEKLRAFLTEAKALTGEKAQARAKLRSCVLRVQIEIAPSYEGSMLTTGGRGGIPDLPDEAVGLVEFIGVTPTFEIDVYDQLFSRWLRDPH